MKKSYFLTFSSKLSIVQCVKLLHARLDMDFSLHESEYFGEYWKYSGMLAESVTVGSNILPTGDLRVAGVEDSTTILEVAINEGKNIDRLARMKYLKDSFNRLGEFEVLKERVVESQN